MAHVLSTIRDRDRFAAIAPAWDALVLGAARPSPYLLHAWLDAWWETAGTGRDVRIICAERDRVLVAGLAVVVERRGPFRVARPPGEPHPALADVLVAPGADDAARAVLDALRDVDVLDLDSLPGGSVAARLRGRRGLRAPRVPAPTLSLGDGFEAAFERATTRKRRGELRRHRRRLDAVGAVAIRVSTTADEVAAALPDVFRLHALRYADRPDASGLGTAHGQALASACLVALAATGRVRLVEVVLAGSPIAFELGLLVGDALYLHRTAFDPDYTRFGPGLRAKVEAMALAAAEGVTRVEMGRGDDPYKLEFADAAEALERVLLVDHRFRGLAYAVPAWAADTLRARLRRNDGLRAIVRRMRLRRAAPSRSRS